MLLRKRGKQRSAKGLKQLRITAPFLLRDKIELNLRSHLSEAESVGHDAVHGVGIHLGPLELEVVDSGFVLPHGVVGVVVELGGVRLAWSRRGEENYSCMSAYHRQSED